MELVERFIGARKAALFFNGGICPQAGQRLDGSLAVFKTDNKAVTVAVVGKVGNKDLVAALADINISLSIIFGVKIRKCCCHKVAVFIEDFACEELNSSARLC